MVKSYNDYKKKVYDHSIDVDNFPKWQKFQCVDLANDYLRYFGYSFIYCTATGYAGDFYYQRNKNGILKSCRLVTKPKKGDIVVFKATTVTPDTHIGIIDKVYTEGFIDVLGQNQPLPKVNIMKFHKGAVAGYFRPIAIANDCIDSQVCDFVPVEFIKSKGSFTVTKDKLTIWNAPNNTQATSSGLYYEKGDTVVYDGYVINNGYRFISWVSKSTGKRRWMRSGKCNNTGYITEPYGKFK